MEDNEKIAVLLAEYNSLRSEVLAARTAATQAVGIGVPVLMASLGLALSSVAIASAGHRYVLAALGVFAVFCICFFVVWNELNTRRFTARIRDIEADVNRRAGERLLTWETDHGWGGLVGHHTRGS